MSRSNKSGLDYFPLDVDFFQDEKVEILSAKCGVISELVIIKLFSRIYHNSYFLTWNDDIAYLFAKKNGDGITKEKIDEIVQETMRLNLFNENLFGKYSILTSKCIQNIYLEATKRRNKIEIIEEFMLISKDNAHILNKNVCIIKLNVNINTQSKVKESKVKESESKVKEKESIKNLLSDKTDDILYKNIFEKRDTLPKKATFDLSLPKKVTYVTQKGNLTLPNRGHTKDNYTKDNYTKDKDLLSPKKFGDDSVEIELSKYLYQKILILDPKHRKPHIQSWAKHINSMIRIDKRTTEEIKDIIDWLFNTNSKDKDAIFWRSNVLSTKKLRDKYDQLIIKKAKSRKQKHHFTQGAIEYMRKEGLFNE